MSHMFGTFFKRGSNQPVCALCGHTNGTLETHRCARFDEELADSLTSSNVILLREQLRKNPYLANKSAPDYR